eukprot:GFUD01032222.1.p1 GENE.GFUD01032222.1~~GFUD01032222.1.p1  ORF type:complete len:255 (+),score=65.62 GFUD01032222.1:99-863(+)
MPRGTTPHTFHNTMHVEMSENLSVCPYVKSHMIRPARMQRHLIICRKDILSKPDHPAYKLVLSIERCPYDATHHIARHEMSRHVAVCSSKREVATPTEVPAWRKAVVVARSEAGIEATEDWDDDGDVLHTTSPYNPQAKILQSTTPILHLPPGLSKAEKSDFRTRQRAKFLGGQTEAFDDWSVVNNLNRLDDDTNRGDGVDKHDKEPADNKENMEVNIKKLDLEKTATGNTDNDEFKIVGKKKRGGNKSKAHMW